MYFLYANNAIKKVRRSHLLVNPIYSYRKTNMELCTLYVFSKLQVQFQLLKM